uniref:Protein slowmo n=1 Tax=Anthurium amnicola TaxID=1678845 RepID=A0A1D1XSK6_9ARAE
MVRAYTQEHVYRHPWDRVTTASWRKFTDSPTVLSHVTDVHTLSRRLDPDLGLLRTTRSITVRSPQLPFLLRRVLGQDSVVCHCVESTVVDAGNRSMEIVVRNVSLRGLIEVEERSRYAPHPAHPDRWTTFRQETSIRCKPLSALAAVAEKVEQRCAERFLQNSAKGREVVERICKYLEAESSSAAAAGI